MTTDEALKQVGGCESDRCHTGPQTKRCGYSETFECGAYISVTNEVRHCTSCENKSVLDHLANLATSMGKAEDEARRIPGSIVNDDSAAQRFQYIEHGPAAATEKMPDGAKLAIEMLQDKLAAMTIERKELLDFFATFGNMPFSTMRAIDWQLSRETEAKDEWAKVYMLWSNLDFERRARNEANLQKLEFSGSSISSIM